MGDIIEIEGYEFEETGRYSRFHKKNEDRCAHNHFILDEHGQTVHCKDCGDQLSNFWTLQLFLDQYRKKLHAIGTEHLKAKSIREDLEKEHKFIKVLRSIQSAWRGKNKMAVSCPWCGVGIMPEDGLGTLTVDPESDFRRKRLIQEREKEPVKALRFFKTHQENGP